MEKIILKKILSDNPITYGDPIEFEFSTTLQNIQVNKSAEYSSYKYSSINEGTDLRTLNAIAGDRFQSFTIDGEKLGFILRYCGTLDTDNMDDRKTWMMYNEEIQCYTMHSLSSNDDEPMFICINREYFLEKFTTIKECLDRAEQLYNLQSYPYVNGMDCSRYQFFQMLYRGKDDNIYYGSRLRNRYQILANTKMRYFSSWYKLITGKFYQEDKLFKMKTIDGYDFVFGRINEITSLNGCVLQEYQNDERLLTEPSYGVKDLIYGTDLSYLVTELNQRVDFQNGIGISYSHRDNSNLYMELRKLDATQDKRISFLGSQIGDDLKKFGIISRLRNVLASTNNFGSDYQGQDNGLVESMSLFVSPQYNNVKPNEFDSVLGTYEHTEEEWKQNLARVITAVSNGVVRTNLDIRSNYNYSVEGFTGDVIHTSIAWTGWAKTNTEHYSIWVGAATNVTDDGYAQCTFVSPEDWMSVAIFVDTDEPDIPGPGPGPTPKPEPVPPPFKKRTSKLNIKELSQMAIKNGAPLLGDVEKLEPFAFMSEYLEDYEMFDEDLGETRGFYWPLWNVENGTEEEVLEHFRKRSAFTIKKHKTEIEGFKAIDDARWNPIENYDRYETNSTKRSGKDTVKDMFDGVSITNEYGKQGSSNVTGEQTGSNTVGEHTSTTTNEHAGFNSSDYQKNGKSTTDSGSQTSNSTVGARTDSSSIDAHTDNMTTEAREDVHETAYDNTTEFETHIHGNIGVTTATQMLEEAKDFYSSWNFYNKLFDLILKELAIFYEE